MLRVLSQNLPELYRLWGGLADLCTRDSLPGEGAGMASSRGPLQEVWEAPNRGSSRGHGGGPQLLPGPQHMMTVCEQGGGTAGTSPSDPALGVSAVTQIWVLHWGIDVRTLNCHLTSGCL